METDILDRQLPTTDYYPQGWLRKLDIFGMVLAPLSISLPFFFLAILAIVSAGSNGISYYEVALLALLTALGLLIFFGRYFQRALKSYVSHQATRDDLITFRVTYSLLILAGLIVDFMIFY